MKIKLVVACNAASEVEPPDCESDTEYPAIEVHTLPGLIRVVGSDNDKLDGEYVRMKCASRGRPCYIMNTGKRPMYLYWVKGKWKVGYEFGSKKSFAFAKEKPGSVNPTSLHPWKLFDRESSEYKDKPSMRVISGDQIPENASSAVKATKRPGDIMDDVPMQFKVAKRYNAHVNSDDSTSAESPALVPTRRPTPPDVHAQQPHQPLLLPPVPSLEKHADGSWIVATGLAANLEARLRERLSKVPKLEQQQRDIMINTIKDRLLKDNKGMDPESVQAVFCRVEKDYGTSTKQEGVPAPRVARLAPAAVTP